MSDEQGQVGSPSPTQPKLLAKARARLEGRIILDKVVRRQQQQHAYYLKRKAARRQAVREYRAAIARGEVPAPAPPPPPPPRAPRPRPPQLVQVSLRMRHSLNGNFYGPGTVTTSEAKARRLLNIEYEAEAKERSLFQEQAFIISFRNGVPVRREVPAQRFDDILAREELPIGDMGGDK